MNFPHPAPQRQGCTLGCFPILLISFILFIYLLIEHPSLIWWTFLTIFILAIIIRLSFKMLLKYLVYRTLKKNFPPQTPRPSPEASPFNRPTRPVHGDDEIIDVQNLNKK